MKKFSLTVISLIIVSIFIGCGGTPPTIKPEVQKPIKLPDERLKRLALYHFIEGALYDAKDDYKGAIIEYQESLNYQRLAVTLYAMARDYSILGKHSLAAQAGYEAVQMEPKNITFREGLANIYLMAFQTELAIKEYEEIVRLDSNNTNAWYQLARQYQSNKPLRALEIYERLLDLDGEQWEILLQLAEVYVNLKKFDKAAEMYERMLALDPSNQVLLKQLAAIYVRAGKSDRAISTLERILENYPNDADALATLGEVYLEQGKYERALELFSRLIKQQKENIEIKLRIGVAYFGRIQKDSSFIPLAKKVFEDLQSQLPNDWRAYWYLGAIAATEKKDSIAIHNFEQVTQLAEWNGDGWYYLGSYYFEKGNYQKTLEIMERAKRAVPKDSRLFFLYGLACAQLKKNDEAIAAYKKSLELNPNDVNTLGSLALALDGLKRFSESDSLYELALKLEPNNHLILNNYGYSLAERGLQLERALQMAKIAVESQPENPSYLDTLGWVYFKLGKFIEAEPYIVKAVNSGEASAVVLEHLGDTYSKLGVKDKAIEWWKKALEKDPENKQIQQKIARGEL